MTHAQAVTDLRVMMYALQRYRGTVMETLGPGTGDLHLTEKMAAETWPWLFGDKCPLPALVKILDNVDAGGSLAPMDYYNMMVVLNRFMPEIKVAIQSYNPELVYEIPSSTLLALGFEEEDHE